MKSSDGLTQFSVFDAAPDAEVRFQASEVAILGNFFRMDPTTEQWIDATGDYDLAMDVTGKSYVFFNRRPASAQFMFRFFPLDYLRRRLNIPQA